VAETNAKGGINGKKLEAVIYDTGGDATKAVQLATKLIKNDKVVAIIGPSTTGESMALVPIAEKRKFRWFHAQPASRSLNRPKIVNGFLKLRLTTMLPQKKFSTTWLQRTRSPSHC